MLGNGHVRFGGRAGETDRRQRRHRAPARPNTELRHRWLVAQRRSDEAGWHMHDGDYATLQDARAYVVALNDGLSTASCSAREHENRSPGG